MKKAIAKHILWLFGLVAVWFGINMTLGHRRHDSQWRTGDDGDVLLLTMLITYVVVFLIHWSVKTIWFNKDKD